MEDAAAAVVAVVLEVAAVPLALDFYFRVFCFSFSKVKTEGHLLSFVAQPC